MKAYLAIKFHADGRNKEKIKKISQILKSLSIITFCMFKDCENWGKIRYSPKKLMQMTFMAIDTCDFVIVDLTETGYGTGIESGYAYATKKPIIVIAEKSSEIHPTLSGIADKIFLYKDIEEIKELKILKKLVTIN